MTSRATRYPCRRVWVQWVTTAVLSSVLWTVQAQQAALPNAANSVKFGVMGDSGSGDSVQFDVANEMAKRHKDFAFDRVIMLGDNIYGGQGPRDLENKFARPYKALLDGGVKFYAALGNHDDPRNRSYPPWNMGGERYYSFATKNVRFFALDSSEVDAKQLAWIEEGLKNAREEWKICFFHHPLYSNGKTHGSAVDLRVVLEPLFVANGVNVVFAGHEHIYERLNPQKGIYHFVSGAAGKLRRGDATQGPTTAVAYDRDLSFMLVEIAGSDLTFQTVSRTGQVIDSGTIHAPARSVVSASREVAATGAGRGR